MNPVCQGDTGCKFEPQVYSTSINIATEQHNRSLSHTVTEVLAGIKSVFLFIPIYISWVFLKDDASVIYLTFFGSSVV